MILSFHPIIEADRNILCAGRSPDHSDLAAIRAARAVILPQGCSEALYRLARENCLHVYPNLDVRFDYPGKLGQIRLFRKLGVPHPATRLFDSVAAFQQAGAPVDYPAVVKWDWGGQGETVFKVDNPETLARVLARTAACEGSGQYGFMVQAFVPTGGRALRVTRIGGRQIDYWRISADERKFGSAVDQGARIDHNIDPELRAAAGKAVSEIIAKTGLQLAGFDIIFNQFELNREQPEPLLLEINYFFGRRGLGGSRRYYDMLTAEVDAWLSERGMGRSPAVADSPWNADETQ